MKSIGVWNLKLCNTFSSKRKSETSMRLNLWLFLEEILRSNFWNKLMNIIFIHSNNNMKFPHKISVWRLSYNEK
ncbi:hypothetical protein BWD13_02745 [Leptospira santarosai serovar Grippotyphosa]|nr:hypothetical protein BWD13_02745 [Leptospira santarosai serovar Grippotyphosa]